MELIDVLCCIAGLQWLYRRTRLSLASSKSPSALGHVIATDRKGDARQIRLRLGPWFSWNVSLNEDHGTAGGSMKLAFPWKSSLVTAAVCAFVALVVSQFTWFIVPGIFACFAFHHARRWWRQLELWHTVTLAIDRLRRALRNSQAARSTADGGVARNTA